MSDATRRWFAVLLLLGGLAPAAAAPAPMEAAVEARVNAIRRERGRPPLASNPVLQNL